MWALGFGDRPNLGDTPNTEHNNFLSMGHSVNHPAYSRCIIAWVMWWFIVLHNSFIISSVQLLPVPPMTNKTYTTVHVLKKHYYYFIKRLQCTCYNYSYIIWKQKMLNIHIQFAYSSATVHSSVLASASVLLYIFKNSHGLLIRFLYDRWSIFRFLSFRFTTL